MENDTLYIPMGVKMESELFNGFGKREFKQAFVGSAFGIFGAFILWCTTDNIAFTMIMVLTSIFGSVIMTTRDSNNQSVVEQIHNMMAYARTQKIYPYRYREEWGLSK